MARYFKVKGKKKKDCKIKKNKWHKKKEI